MAKYKIVTDGNRYIIFKRFLFWWLMTYFPSYRSIKECKKAIFEIDGVLLDEVLVENKKTKEKSYV